MVVDAIEASVARRFTILDVFWMGAVSGATWMAFMIADGLEPAIRAGVWGLVFLLGGIFALDRANDVLDVPAIAEEDWK